MNLDQARAYIAERGLNVHRAPGAAFSARVLEPGSVVLREWAKGRSTPVREMAPPRARLRRTFAGGEQSGYTMLWGAQDQHVNLALMRNLRTLRARANDLARNNDYARQFLRMVKANVVGPMGARLQVRVLKGDGMLNERESMKAEQAFAKWTRAEACDFRGELSWRDMQRLWIETVARDGEVLVRRWKGSGPYGYQLQLLSPALLDESYNVDLPDGHRIRMSIEFDASWRRVAYHLLADEPADPRLGLGLSRRTVRVPAEEIWHDFVPEWIGQMRGIPWMCTTLIRQKRLASFETAAVAAAEEGAKKLAWIETADGDLTTMADQVAEQQSRDDPESGTLYTDSGDGIHYARLPSGAKLHDYDPKFPDAAVGPFVKSSLRGVAAGLGVTYHGLSNDLEGVNYSSARVGELEVREVWKALQEWMIERLHARVYSEWLPFAILSGHLAVPMDRLQRYDVATWQGRRWSWVDPRNDVEAKLKELDAGLTSRQRIIREAGNDPDEIWRELEQERERLAGLLPSPAAPQNPAADPPADPANPDDEEDDDE